MQTFLAAYGCPLRFAAWGRSYERSYERSYAVLIYSASTSFMERRTRP